MESRRTAEHPVIARGIAALGVVLMCCPGASALDASLDVSQYAHTAWTVRDGFFKGVISSYAIAQTPDGYLWLGTEFGLLRFDGVRSVPWQAPPGERLPGGSIRSLLAARDGRLWIGTSEGLASWKDGTLTHYPEVSGQVRPLIEDREGTVWAGGFVSSTGRLCAIQKGGTHCYGADGRFGREVISLYEDSRGSLWAGALTGLWRWKPGPPQHYRIPEGVRFLAGGDDGALLIVTREGIKRLVDGNAEPYPLPGVGPLESFRVLRDRNGGLWIGTVDRGIVHVHQGRTDVFTRADGLSGDFVQGFFEDREGNIWVTTSDGLDRFRDVSVPTVSVKQGLSNAFVWSVLAARDGSVWFGTRDGLNRWANGRMTVYRKRSHGLPDDSVEAIFEDDRERIWVFTNRGAAYFENGRFTLARDVPVGPVDSIAGDRVGNLWLNQDQSLVRLFQGRVVERIPWSQLGRAEAARALLYDPGQAGLWIGFNSSVAFFKDGQIRGSYAHADGLGDGRVSGLHLDREGALWAATEGGLSRVKNGRIATLTSANGLPCDIVHWVMEADDESFWLDTVCGLVRIAKPELDGWTTDPKRTIQTTVFDKSDGVSSHSLPFSRPRVARSLDGKIWFLTLDGVSVIDPRHLAINKTPPPVHVEHITADHKTYAVSSDVRLPPLIHDLEIDYTALSLVAPEKNRFRIKLEGWDSEWQDVADRRQAFYTNLAPGQYRFRVTASNNSGVWNDAGAFVDLSIAPAYYQTRWFRATVVVTGLALFWAFHRLRVRQLAREFNLGLEGRVSERTRIARELHDTLLQSFHGLLLDFQAATNQLPDGPVKRRFESAVDQGAQAIAEGRDAVQGLRLSALETNDLADAVNALGQELATTETLEGAAAFQVAVEGTPRNLHPILRDEVYRIAGEALRNAFRHAHARLIEVEIRYDAHQLRLRIRDNGRGMTPQMPVGQSASGHFGVAGMHERATAVGGHLDIWSEIDRGTEVELSVPASIAYATPSTRSSARRFSDAGS